MNFIWYLEQEILILLGFLNNLISFRMRFFMYLFYFLFILLCLKTLDIFRK
jgi:hypothetical protein